jgi:hypothetical protein
MVVSSSVDANYSVNVSNNRMPAPAGTPVTVGIPALAVTPVIERMAKMVESHKKNRTKKQGRSNTQ